MHIVEKFTRKGNELQYDITIEDPDVIRRALGDADANPAAVRLATPPSSRNAPIARRTNKGTSSRISFDTDRESAGHRTARFGIRNGLFRSGGLMRRISGLILLGAAIGLVAPLCAAGPQAQNQARPPEGFRIIGNIYWVGGEYGSYLITTPQGHILHDTGTSEMHDVIVSNVKKLGFDVKDIKMLISSHAHFDHVQGHATMKKLTGAQVIALGGDAAALEAGQDNSAGDQRHGGGPRRSRHQGRGDVSLGGVTLRALWVPGHTQGATVWITTVSEGGKNYSVAFRGGEIPNAGFNSSAIPGTPRSSKIRR